MKRPFGAHGRGVTADFALLLLEPVRSAEPRRIPACSTIALDRCLPARFAGRRQPAAFPAAPLCARIALAEPGRPLVPHAALEFACFRIDAANARLPAISRARVAAPAARQAFSTSSGTENGIVRPAELWRAGDLVGAERLAVPWRCRLVRRAVADGGLAGDQRRLADFARRRSRRQSPPDRGRRRARPASRRP